MNPPAPPGELAMNAYVLLGNALHYALNRMRADSKADLDASGLAALHARIEPLPPSAILAAVEAFPPKDRALLGRLCRAIVQQLAPEEADAVLGLPPEVVKQTLVALGL